MSGYEDWKSFTTKDLFDDFNEVIQSAYDNTYSVSLKNYETHLESFKEFNKFLELLLSPDEKNRINHTRLNDLISNGLSEVEDYKNNKKKIEESMKEFKNKNTKEFKIDKHCLNNLKDDMTFKDSKTKLSFYFKLKESSEPEALGAAAGEPAAASSVAPPASPAASPAAAAGEPTAVQPGQEVELGGTTTAAAAAAVSSVTPKPAAGV